MHKAHEPAPPVEGSDPRAEGSAPVAGPSGGPSGGPSVGPSGDHAAPIVVPRAMTVEDPITTQLLAEVARTSHTVDFDDAVIDDAIENLGTTGPEVPGDDTPPHPHVRRRPR